MFKCLHIALALILSIAGVHIHAAETGEDKPALDVTGETQKCIRIASISRTDIIDQSNILFYMRDGTVYLNALPRKCPRLRPRTTFGYKTSLNQLCNVDTINIVDTTGPGISRGPTCGLGMFTPITKEQALLLKSDDAVTPEPDQVTPEIEGESDEKQVRPEIEAAPAETN